MGQKQIFDSDWEDAEEQLNATIAKGTQPATTATHVDDALSDQEEEPEVVSLTTAKQDLLESTRRFHASLQSQKEKTQAKRRRRQHQVAEQQRRRSTSIDVPEDLPVEVLDAFAQERKDQQTQRMNKQSEGRHIRMDDSEQEEEPVAPQLSRLVEGGIRVVALEHADAMKPTVSAAAHAFKTNQLMLRVRRQRGPALKRHQRIPYRFVSSA